MSLRLLMTSPLLSSFPSGSFRRAPSGVCMAPERHARGTPTAFQWGPKQHPRSPDGAPSCSSCALAAPLRRPCGALAAPLRRPCGALAAPLWRSCGALRRPNGAVMAPSLRRLCNARAAPSWWANGARGCRREWEATQVSGADPRGACSCAGPEPSKVVSHEAMDKFQRRCVVAVNRGSCACARVCTGGAGGHHGGRSMNSSPTIPSP